MFHPDSIAGTPFADNQGPVLFVRWAWNIPEPLLAGIPPEPVRADPARLIAKKRKATIAEGTW